MMETLTDDENLNPITGNVWRCLKSAGGGGQFAPPLISQMFLK